MDLALRAPGTERSQDIQPYHSQERLAYELGSKNAEQKALAISELAAKGESFVTYHLDVIISELHKTYSSEVKQAVCQAIISSGLAAQPYYNDISPLVNDADPQVRYWGCLALASLGRSASGAKRQATALLQDEHEAVRFGACSLLGSIQAEDTLDDLRGMLEDNSPEVQGAACLALGKLGVAGTSCAALVATKLQEGRSRNNALKALALMGLEGGKHCQAVCECLEDDEAETRVLAASVVGKMAEYIKGDSVAMERIVSLARDPDGRKRSAAALALGYLGKVASSHKSVISELLSDPFEEEAENALTLGGCRPRMPASCRKTKCAAAAALGRIASEDRGYGWDSIATELASLLDDDDWEVKVCALEALGCLGSRASNQTEKVRARFKDEKYIVRAKAARAYGQIGDPETVSLLADLLQDGSPSVKCEAASALAKLGDDGAEFCDKVFELYRNPNPEVRAAAITALAGMGKRGQYYATATAQMLHPHEHPAVRVAAMEALIAMGERGAAFKDLIEEQQKDEMPGIRAAAARCLDSLGIGGPGMAALQDNGDEE
eukprot:TRINITY_DN31769_c0_g1_i1.p1 TRINITY_DN31769_c0_g1~~TRINITY_DN31769_c0_g1_i1.p1  ORF type:complete len:553 (+),score=137.27 TRINITY_DN31769_c0_g1_i1:85-1743(+)